MQVYGRLSRLGISVTQPTVNKLVRLCGTNYDQRIKVWRKNWEFHLKHETDQPQNTAAQAQSGTSLHPGKYYTGVSRV